MDRKERYLRYGIMIGIFVGCCLMVEMAIRYYGLRTTVVLVLGSILAGLWWENIKKELE